MKFYIIDEAYITFLKQTDPNVPNNYNQKRPYIGVVLIVNGIKYLAPLTSYKPKQDKMKNSPSFLKIHDRSDTSNKLGMIQLNNMLPVVDEVISLLDMEAQETKYRAMLYKQYEFLKHQESTLKKKADKLYQLVVIKQHPHFVKVSCNFKALEAVYLEFDKS